MTLYQDLDDDSTREARSPFNRLRQWWNSIIALAAQEGRH